MAERANARRMFASLNDAEGLRKLAETSRWRDGLDRTDGLRAGVQNESAGMFAALSATNEAIMRAQTRAELFRLVCEAAVHGGKFTTTLIGLAEPGDDFLRVVATAGPTCGDVQGSGDLTALSRRARFERNGVSHAPALHQQ